MSEHFLGIDIGSISTKCVVIDQDNKIVYKDYIWTNGNPVEAVKGMIDSIKGYNIKGIGTTGSARNLIGIMLDANVIKNEITAHGVGAMTKYKDVKTILEIGGQDSKIILIENGIIKDYAMNTLCAAGTGSFLSSQAKRLNIDIKEFGDLALKSKNPVKIAARCTVFAESDLVHKAQLGYNTEDIVAGLCRSIVINYLNNVAKGKNIEEPIVFQGGVSKNIGVVKYFEKILGKKVLVDDDSHLMGAYGIAVMSKKNKKNYNLNFKDIKFVTKGYECELCGNNCEIINIYKDDKIIDIWGSKCGKISK
ncbi:MAG: acyl-CoA dehydratase activase [Bacilli bacterium]